MSGACLGTAGMLLKSVNVEGVEQVQLPQPPPIEVHGTPMKPSPMGMPGLFPGRVIELHNPKAIVANHVSRPIVRQMIDRGMRELTGAKSATTAWKRFFKPEDIVGIKINPSGAPYCNSSPEIVCEIIRNLKLAGLPTRNILVYDRYSDEIEMGSYHALLPVGIRVVGVEYRAFDLSGYDMDVYCQADFFGEWETRSYLASVVSRDITKIVNVPTFKDHDASGVTGCLKNLGYGSFNNVARSHKPPITFTDPLIGVMCSCEPLRSRAVLNIMDGMRQVWHGGPITDQEQFIAQTGKIFIGTDPVAVDTIELKEIEKKRQAEGALSLWDRNPANITRNQRLFHTDMHKNLFYRQPAHIEAAGKLGLGVWEMNKIEHRVIEL